MDLGHVREAGFQCLQEFCVVDITVEVDWRWFDAVIGCRVCVHVCCFLLPLWFARDLEGGSWQKR